MSRPVAVEMKPLAQSSEGEDDDQISCSMFCKNFKNAIKEKTAKDWAITFAKFCALVACLYIFLFSLDLMGTAFKVLGGCSAGGMFSDIDNPIAGLMIGILATVLVQSSSTSTSIVVSLVGAGSMDVRLAIPVIMGANIGTSVTNTIVSMGQAADPDQFEKAFSGATVHDMFNFASVLILLPIEWITGVLYHLTSAMTPAEVSKGEKWVGPIKIMVGPFVKLFIESDKKVISSVALGKYTCEERYADVADGSAKAGLIKAGAFFSKNSTLQDDMATGGVVLFISLVLLCVCLAILVKLLQSMVLGTSEKMLRKATDLNPYLAMIVGMGITILVQSSSVTTSVLTPLVGVGVLPLEKMFPLTLGANIGTTFTAILASLVSSKPEAVQIALAHLFFNLIGILIWYPVPFMRRIPLNAAKGLGAFTRRYRTFPLVYIFATFVVIPLILLGISSLFMGTGVGYHVLGTILTVFIGIALIYFLFWWIKRDGKKKFFKFLEDRQNRANFKSNLQNRYELLEKRMGTVEKKLCISVDHTGDSKIFVKSTNSPKIISRNGFQESNKNSPKNSEAPLYPAE